MLRFTVGMQLNPCPCEPEKRDAVAVVDRWDLEHSWHPFTQMAEYVRLPRVHVERGEGCWLFDGAGRRYLDANASVWTNVHGHNDPDLNAALREQLEKVAHSTYLGLSHPVGAALGRRLADLAPEGLDRVVFSDNGSNAIEIALKQSFQFWQLVGKPAKQKVVGLEGAYHGDTFGTMSVGDSRGFHGRFARWSFETHTLPRPTCVERGGRVFEASMEASLSALETLLERESGQIASVIMEPWVQGAAGMQLQPRGFLREVASLCRRYDVHLILDEVFVGFGRMGSFFVCEQEGVAPDFLCLAKGLAAGYLPLAATLSSEAIYEAFLGDFDSGRGFYHGHTFTGNPLAAAVALKSIEKLDTYMASGRLQRCIETFGRELCQAFEGHPCVKALRQRGLAAAIDLCPAGDPEASWPANDRMGMRVCVAAREQGLLLRPLLDSILIAPPIVIAEEEIRFLFKGLRRAIEAVILEGK